MRVVVLTKPARHCLVLPMSRRTALIRLALPVTVLAAATLLLLSRCGENPGQAGDHAVARLDNTPLEKEPDPDTWGAAFARQEPPPVDLQRDPAEASGTLDNGLRYVLIEQREEPGRVSLRLLVKAGSLHEEETERGLAHFVEHMAFRGTTRQPQGRTMDVFERLGLKTGADTNAWTAQDATCYKLDIPDADEAALETAFTWLRDVADGVLFREADVDAERLVVMRELDERKDSACADRRAAVILPDVRAAQRAPIGLQSVLEKATAAQLSSFWQRHYVPSRMVVVAAGDFAQREMTARLVRHFSPLPAREAPPEPETGNPLTDEGATIECVRHAEEDGRIRLTIAAPQPVDREPDSPAMRRRSLVRHLGLTMMKHRENRTATSRDIGLALFSSGQEEVVPRLGWLEISGNTRQASLSAALEHLACEWRRARDKGFNDLEFAEARSEFRKEARRRLASRLSRSTADTADRLVESERRRHFYEAPEVELNRTRTDLANITREECEALIREAWSHPVIRFVLSGEVTAEMEQAAAETLQRAWAKPPEPPPLAKPPRSLVIAPFGETGRLTRRSVDRERGCLDAEFANHVLLRIKPMSGLGGMATVRVLLGHGRLSVPPDRPGLIAAAHLLEYWHPLAGWNQPELEAALADIEADTQFACGENAFEWLGQTDRATLARQLELLCACLVRPGLEGLPTPWHPGTTAITWVEMQKAGVDASLLALRRQLMGDDPRFAPLTESFKLTDDRQAADWLVPFCREARVCIIIAGDFAPQEALASAARTFGAIPLRTAWHEPSPFPLLPVPDPGVRREHPDKGRHAEVFLSLPLERPRNTTEDLQAGLLAEVIKLRMRRVLREELGASYSPGSRTSPSPDLARYWLRAQVRCADGKSEVIGEALHQLVAGLHRDGWSEDEFKRAARPLAWTIRAAARSPESWLDWLEEPHLCPVPAKLDAATLLKMEPQVKELARRVLDPAAAIELRVEPDTTPAE